ncbi:alpha-glucosidase [Actinoplanes tereljensis]|uniref:Alpha-glucosidase n=1 Tax=Paractinoplanes tereljensis TaxID=571912 RepID=A0A919NFP3_9ACTN|nr:glycoside hydrolase family 13 protein [Actinoplanes tereljensis]GIF17310.1 alpha-glucosidase [Actinoplanes tereljensis]
MSWWRHAVIYQVYVWSFADSNGDGIGDLPGVRSRLPYLRDLGVDAIWLNPFYPSPQADNGYDVADHRDVDPRFGTLADADALLSDAHALGLRVIIDLVPNHTSSAHPWFVAGQRDRYLFREGRGSEPPNNWQSAFGGPAWTRVADGQWYLHLFAPEQPDLDWTNPEVRAEFEDILRFWFDRGVDGFRIDVAHGLAKDPQMPDLHERFAERGAAAAGHPFFDVDEVHEVYRDWRRISDAYPGDRVFVGEIWVQSADRLALYLRPDELHTAFNFAFLSARWKAGDLRTAIDDTLRSLAAVGAPPTWVLSNHDVVRHVTRYGSVQRARAATLLMLALPGSAYLYQGEELGLPQVTDLPDEVRRDPEFHRGQSPGRDGCRVPLPWFGSSPSYGFGPGSAAWLPQPPSWAGYVASRQSGDPSSVLSLYRAALRLRPGFGDGPLTWLPSAPEVLAFRRSPDAICVVNVGDEPAPLPAEVRGRTPALTSAPLENTDTISGATAAWFLS